VKRKPLASNFANTLFIISLKKELQSKEMNQIGIQAEREYRIFGLQRSGNNAVIGWIIKSTTSEKFFLKATNCSFIGNQKVFIPFDRGTGPITSVNTNSKILAANSWHLFDPTEKTIARLSAKRNIMNGEMNDEEWISNNEDPTWDQSLRTFLEGGVPTMLNHVETLGERAYNGLFNLLQNVPTPLAAIIYHIEDFPIEFRSDIPFESSPVRAINTDYIKNIFVLRDFRNWVASRIKSGRNVDNVAIELWKQFAQAYQNQSNYSDVCFINFNLWKKDEGYRQDIAKNLEIEDNGLSQRISVAGGGSSFDGIHSNQSLIQGIDQRERQLTGEHQKQYELIIKNNSELTDFSDQFI
jgi:hypothetical protein